MFNIFTKALSINNRHLSTEITDIELWGSIYTIEMRLTLCSELYLFFWKNTTNIRYDFSFAIPSNFNTTWGKDYVTSYSTVAQSTVQAKRNLLHFLEKYTQAP